MKNIVLAVLLAVVFLSGCSRNVKTDPNCVVCSTNVVTTEQLDELINSKEDVFVFDARSAAYDDGKRIPTSESLSYNATAKEVAKVIPSKNSLVVTYCSNLQCPASAKLAKYLHKLGYTNVKEYPQGIEGWVKSGRHVVDA